MLCSDMLMHLSWIPTCWHWGLHDQELRNLKPARQSEMLVIKISAEKSLCDPLLLPTVELKQITAVLHHIKRTFLVELHRSKFYSCQCLQWIVCYECQICCTGSWNAFVTGFVQSVYERECDQNLAFKEYISKIFKPTLFFGLILAMAAELSLIEHIQSVSCLKK